MTGREPLIPPGHGYGIAYFVLAWAYLLGTALILRVLA